MSISKNRQSKMTKIKAMKNSLTGVQTAILINFSKLSVRQLENFRNELQKLDAKASVYKNTLLERALLNTPYAGLAKNLRGSLMLVASSAISLPLIKIVHQFQNQYPEVKYRGAFFEQNILTPVEIIALAQLPTISESLSNLLGLLQAPLVNLISLLRRKAETMSK